VKSRKVVKLVGFRNKACRVRIDALCNSAYQVTADSAGAIAAPDFAWRLINDICLQYIFGAAGEHTAFMTNLVLEDGFSAGQSGQKIKAGAPFKSLQDGDDASADL
jgi:hypothetical protein